jgi:hypothetical protein
MLATKYFGLDLPYGEYWIPLLAGLGIGLMVVGFIHRFLRREPAAPPPKPTTAKKSLEYDPFVQGSATEQRRALRRGGNPVEIFIGKPEQKDNAMRGWVLDRSMGGLCLLASHELEEGSLWGVLPVNATPITPWVEVEVRSCRSVAEGWEVGCQFVKQPPWAVLLLFG